MNKREREIKEDIDSLRMQLSDKKISQKDFDKVFDAYSKELESIDEEKSKLIDPPPMPPPPNPEESRSGPHPDTDKPESKFGLDLIKSSILGRDDKDEAHDTKEKPDNKEKDVSSMMEPADDLQQPEPPRLPEAPKPKAAPGREEPPSDKPPAGEAPDKKKPSMKLPKPPKAREKAVKPKTSAAKKRKKARKRAVKKRIKRVPVVKEVKVPVVKEKIKKVPVIKEVIKEVKVPAGDPEMAKNIEKNFKVMNDLKLDIAKGHQELSSVKKNMGSIKKRLRRADELRSEVNALSVKVGKIDFRGLNQDIYNRFNAMKKSIEDGIKNAADSMSGSGFAEHADENSDDIKDLQSDINRSEKAISGILKETGKLAEMAREAEEMRSSMNTLKTKIGNIDFQGLTKEIYNQFDKMNTSIRESDKKTNDLVEKMNVEMKTVGEKMDETAQAREHVENLDIANIRRDMEVLKQKSQYIEKHIERVDIKPVLDMIKEIENRVETLKASSAMIIE